MVREVGDSKIRTLDDEGGWLNLYEAGLSMADIAREVRLSLRRVQLGVQRARQREGQLSLPVGTSHRLPRLVPMYGSSAKALRLLTCDDVHHGPIAKNSRLYCEICGKSGCDHWPVLRRPWNAKPRHAYRPNKLKGGLG